MGFIEREADRVGAALLATDPATPRWRELFAA